jgi:hypothetical protein
MVRQVVLSILTTVFERLSCEGKKERIVKSSRDLRYSNNDYNALAYNFVKNKLIVHERNRLQLQETFFLF